MTIASKAALSRRLQVFKNSAVLLSCCAAAIGCTPEGAIPRTAESQSEFSSSRNSPPLLSDVPLDAEARSRDAVHVSLPSQENTGRGVPVITASIDDQPASVALEVSSPSDLVLGSPSAAAAQPTPVEAVELVSPVELSPPDQAFQLASSPSVVGANQDDGSAPSPESVDFPEVAVAGGVVSGGTDAEVQSETPEAGVPRIALNNALRPAGIQTAPEDAPNQLRDVTPSAAPVGETSDAAPLPGQPIDYSAWPRPAVSLVLTGQQHGYIEPCGCTGLEFQKGGIARRATFLDQLRDKGWELLPIDSGNLIRNFGSQGEIKYHRSVEALRKMGYQAAGFGPDDIRVSVNDLLGEAVAESADTALYASANVSLIEPGLVPTYKVIRQGGMKIAVTSILDSDFLKAPVSPDIIVAPIIESARKVLADFNQEQPDFRVLTFFGTEEAAQQLMRDVPGFDLVVVSGGYGEPTYQAESIEGSRTKLLVTGDKGMYAGLVGIYPDKTFRYARVPLSDKFEDSDEMRELFREYQNQLRDLGLGGLGIRPIPHPKDDRFVGSQTCGSCHTQAFQVWQGSPHFAATQSIVTPRERGDIPRHFDPECLSCHVTGWNPQKYYPYESGFLGLLESSHLTGNGCENCHGPGAAHSKAELTGSGVSTNELQRLRLGMQLPLDRAREKCMECHDLDNSPDFHDEDAFLDIYWPEVEHYGLD